MIAHLGIDVIDRIYNPIRAFQPALTFGAFAPQADFRLNPAGSNQLTMIYFGTADMVSTHFAQGAIFRNSLRVASTLGVPTSSSVAAACRFSDDSVVRSNCNANDMGQEVASWLWQPRLRQ